MSNDIPASNEVGMHRMKQLVAPIQVAIVELSPAEALQLTASVVMTIAMNFCQRAYQEAGATITPVDIFELALSAFNDGATVEYELYTGQKKRAEGGKS